MGKDRTKLRKKKEKSVKVMAIEGELSDLALNLQVVGGDAPASYGETPKRRFGNKRRRGREHRAEKRKRQRANSSVQAQYNAPGFTNLGGSPNKLRKKNSDRDVGDADKSVGNGVDLGESENDIAGSEVQADATTFAAPKAEVVEGVSGEEAEAEAEAAEEKEEVAPPIEKVRDWEYYSYINKRRKKYIPDGISRELQKDFVPTIKLPDPTAIRPLKILKRAFRWVKEQWIENGDYDFVSEQMSSLRQDLAFQNIRTSFTAKVYETHARLAIEKNDKVEFQQCARILRVLYGTDDVSGNPTEFYAYMILTALVDNNPRLVVELLKSLTKEEIQSTEVSYALSVVKAVKNKDKTEFDTLVSSAPKMSGLILARLQWGGKKA
eukprot:TRINITY_DN3024_c0_g2_i1.p1 TRINITY_DN3024_c0_g2~~TRINITY_DN3024_c0_g2_i1.p1  ORF type:complete len:389 (-),score=124.99 TRINITY_DN3024_c0_g2_i1:171-1310(-)